MSPFPENGWRVLGCALAAMAATMAAAQTGPDAFSAAWDRLAKVDSLNDEQRKDLDTIATAYEQAGIDAAQAETRLASHTGAILCRELKKVPTSARLIEITKKTGRSSEVERYEERHQNLLKMIDTAATEYAEMIQSLCTRSDEWVQGGFADYAKFLEKQGLADQIRINEIVKSHYDGCRESGETDLDGWKKDLKEM